MKDPTLTRSNPSVTHAQIDEFILGLSGICEVFLKIVNVCSDTTHRLSDEECDDFEFNCKLFGERWRKTLRGRPHKLHLLESHLWVQMREYRIMSCFDEGSIERLHHWWLITKRIFAPIRNWQIQANAMLSRYARQNTAAVQTIINSVAAGTKRKKGQPSQKNIEKMKQKTEVKQEHYKRTKLSNGF
jgi:hypothetical protein